MLPKINKIRITDRAKTIFCGILVLLISYFTYFNGYSKMQTVIFDERYNIIHAERYLNGVIYFDVNPPIAKLFIALGEKIFNPNKGVDLSEHIKRGYIFDDVGPEFSFVGVRFFPTLFAFFSALFFFLILHKLSKNNFLSLIFSSMYLFENSAIVHSRTAMIDSTMIFFSFLATYYFLYLYEKKERKTYVNYFLFGGFTGLAAFTKFVGFISLLLFLFLSFHELGLTSLKGLKDKIWPFIKVSVSYFLGIFIIGFFTYYLHIALCTSIIVEDDNRDIKSKIGASKEYVDLIAKKDLSNPLKLYVPMRDYFNYVTAPQSLLPGLNDVINSSPLLWPFGIKNVIYNGMSGDEGRIDKSFYLKFQGNAVSWLMGLVAVFASLTLIASKFVFKAKVSNQRLFNYIVIFTSLYIGFMIAVTYISTKRPLFIHTYLLPLFFSFILFFLLFNYFFEKEIITKNKIFSLAVFLLISLVLYVFCYTSPLTYARPLTYLECEKTRMVNYWEDDCVSQ